MENWWINQIFYLSIHTTSYSDSGDGYGEWRSYCLRMVCNSKTLHIVREEQGNFTFPYTTYSNSNTSY
ncbi:hypothetical protein [Dulcicalothrix desertica]|uniref:hypothetical protein n=1 Tax=Dulcicalothrix desertica TaxID=32056 RepID=UPI000F8C4819|nr:hypothetical protein [Dulcicalothrix desertica]